MRVRKKLTVILLATIVWCVLLAGCAVLRISRTRNALRSLQAISTVRSEILLSTVHVRVLSGARKANKMAVVAREAAQLRQVWRTVDATIEGFLLGGGKEDLPTVRDDEFRRSYLNLKNQWVPCRDALVAIVEGRSVLRNQQEVSRRALDVHASSGAIVQAHEKEYNEQFRLASACVWWLVIGLCALGGVGWWVLRQDVFMPLDSTVEIMELMSSGNVSVAAEIPFRSGTDVGDLRRHFNRLLQRLRRADRTKDSFLATMSHEIRTPLNGVVGFLQNLRETELNEQQRQYVHVIESSARALMRIISDILDFSKIAAGKMELESVAFDPVKVAAESVEVTRQAIRRKSVEARLVAPGPADVVIRGDPTRFKQVLDNLLSNAAKFTESGVITTSIRVVSGPGDSAVLHAEVKDTGIGIPATEHRHLFEAFTQAETNTTRKYGGTGLGLSIAANLVSLMGGELTVDSTPGHGTTFVFSIVAELAPSEEQIRLSPHYAVTLPRSELRKRWVLLVDDTPTNLFLMETICQGIGLPYMTATNGKQAVERCQETAFDLIFMDIQMPVMDGYTAVREIRKLPNGATSGIVALTASAMREDVEAALGAGSTGFLAKPFERNQLLMCIADHLGITAEPEVGVSARLDEDPADAAVRGTYDYMRQQYQISIGEIKMVLAQSVADWRPRLDDLTAFAGRSNWPEVQRILHQLRGQLGATGLPAFAAMAEAIDDTIREGSDAGVAEDIKTFIAELSAVFVRLESQITVSPAQADQPS